MRLKIGTRGSRLALWQAHHVAEKLRAGGVDSEIVTISTRGDKRQDVTIAEIGTRGVFTEEIEEQLQQKTIDLAVHSAKDLQSSLPNAFEIVAFTEREHTADVLVSHQEFSWQSNQAVTIGTSSVRRRALLKHYFPRTKVVEMRGNLQTRMAKMDSGQCDALMLAYAGVHRMQYNTSIVHQFPLDQMIPAVGQGSVAVEILTSLDSDKKNIIRKLINHEITEQQLQAERAYLKALRGGCSVPVFALATIQADSLQLQGGVVSLDGKTLLRDIFTGSRQQPEEIGNMLAEKIISQGGLQVLEAIRG
ncbi:MAG: hydroxymethylbilane synthase [Bacteroidota bacterium]